MRDIPNDHIFARPDRVLQHRHPDSGRADLYVLTSVFNAVRYRSRWKLYQDWIKRVQESGAEAWVVEIAFHDRDFVVRELDPKPDYLLELVTYDELWLKENALNVLTQHLTAHRRTWKYVYFCDADMRHARDDWANEIVQLLQHYSVIQGWTEMADLNHKYEIASTIRSFFSNWKDGLIKPSDGCYYAGGPKGKYPGAPGLGQAWRRDALEAVGGLIDWGILGACDSYIAWALIGHLERAVRRDFTPGYVQPMFKWQEKATRYIQQNLGCMDGLALHFFHGPKPLRKYATRERILAKYHFDPAVHLKKDTQGLYQLEKSAPNYEELRDALRLYFREREEDIHA